MGTDRAVGQQAGPHRFAPEVYRAGAALGDAAAELGAGHPKLDAQRPQQRYVIGDVDSMGLAVDQ